MASQRWTVRKIRIRRLLLLVATIYCGVLLLLMLFESTIMYPAPLLSDGDWQAAWLAHEDVQLISADGTRLHAWYCEHSHPQRTILFCHGNGEHVAYLAEELDFLRQRFQANVLALDYRGYGKSEGTPFEAGILADGEAAQLWLAERTGQRPDEIVLFGRSLGGAVAVHLAAKQGAQALILDRTFSSMVAVAASHFPWLPVRLLLRNRYPSDRKIEAYTGPVLQFHGRPDEVVPYRLAQALFAASRSANKQFVTSETLSHNSAWPNDYYDRMDDFLNAIDSAR